MNADGSSPAEPLKRHSETTLTRMGAEPVEHAVVVVLGRVDIEEAAEIVMAACSWSGAASENGEIPESAFFDDLLVAELENVQREVDPAPTRRGAAKEWVAVEAALAA